MFLWKIWKPILTGFSTIKNHRVCTIPLKNLIILLVFHFNTKEKAASKKCVFWKAVWRNMHMHTYIYEDISFDNDREPILCLFMRFIFKDLEANAKNKVCKKPMQCTKTYKKFFLLWISLENSILKTFCFWKFDFSTQKERVASNVEILHTSCFLSYVFWPAYPF